MNSAGLYKPVTEHGLLSTHKHINSNNRLWVLTFRNSHSTSEIIHEETFHKRERDYA